MDDLKWHNDGLDAQRERIATAAMASLISRNNTDRRSPSAVAFMAVGYANALIKELNKEARDGD